MEFFLEMIFSVIIGLTMFICFFSLSSSMLGNLYEQCKEISLMRAIGFSKNRITKLYVYEAFILVIASSINGVIIGTVTGWVITFLRMKFIDNMPTIYLFPVREFILVIAISLVCAFLATYSPSRTLMAKSIPDIARTV
jgi:ABC-type antimicrobial peptide transport system permease subunit